jgi:hypothetical protein
MRLERDARWLAAACHDGDALLRRTGAKSS